MLRISAFVTCSFLTRCYGVCLRVSLLLCKACFVVYYSAKYLFCYSPSVRCTAVARYSFPYIDYVALQLLTTTVPVGSAFKSASSRNCFYYFSLLSRLLALATKKLFFRACFRHGAFLRYEEACLWFRKEEECQIQHTSINNDIN